MIDKLRAFVSKHKQEFDTAEPSQDLWKKIDSKIEMKNPSAVNSKWLSKLKYFVLSASVLVIAVYFISQSMNHSSSNELAQHKKDSALNSSGEWVKANQNKEVLNKSGNKIPDSDHKKNASEYESSSGQTESLTESSANPASDELKDAQNQNSALESGADNSSNKETDKSASNSLSEKKDNVTVLNYEKQKITIPADPEKTDSYSSTLYEGYSLCSVLRAYKFPGQVNMDKHGNYTSKRIMKTISCNRLENVSDIKAVWVKGKTSKKLSISIKEGFKNIVLIKSDGREIKPHAISHYYPGLGVITDYSGKYFELLFKDKVELILFFTEVEAGDKINIDGVIEAVVKIAP